MDHTDKIRRRYNRASLLYDWMDWMLSDQVRRQVVRHARGRVLEVGVGTGKNLRLYPPDCEVTGIDFSPGMLRKARERARGLADVTLLEMDVQELEFPDDSFDTIIATCVFCSVPDPVKGLRELRRVCRPDGKLVFLEHVRSEQRMMGLLMDMLNPVTVKLIGVNINRRTVENIIKAGLEPKDVTKVNSEILKLIVARPNKA